MIDRNITANFRYLFYQYVFKLDFQGIFDTILANSLHILQETGPTPNILENMVLVYKYFSRFQMCDEIIDIYLQNLEQFICIDFLDNPNRLKILKSAMKCCCNLVLNKYRRLNADNNEDPVINQKFTGYCMFIVNVYQAMPDEPIPEYITLLRFLSRFSYMVINLTGEDEWVGTEWCNELLKKIWVCSIKIFNLGNQEKNVAKILKPFSSFCDGLIMTKSMFDVLLIYSKILPSDYQEIVLNPAIFYWTHFEADSDEILEHVAIRIILKFVNNMNDDNLAEILNDLEVNEQTLRVLSRIAKVCIQSNGKSKAILLQYIFTCMLNDSLLTNILLFSNFCILLGKVASVLAELDISLSEKFKLIIINGLQNCKLIINVISYLAKRLVKYDIVDLSDCLPVIIEAIPNCFTNYLFETLYLMSENDLQILEASSILVCPLIQQVSQYVFDETNDDAIEEYLSILIRFFIKIIKNGFGSEGNFEYYIYFLKILLLRSDSCNTFYTLELCYILTHSEIHAEHLKNYLFLLVAFIVNDRSLAEVYLDDITDEELSKSSNSLLYFLDYLSALLIPIFVKDPEFFIQNSLDIKMYNFCCKIISENDEKILLYDEVLFAGFSSILSTLYLYSPNIDDCAQFEQIFQISFNQLKEKSIEYNFLHQISLYQILASFIIGKRYSVSEEIVILWIDFIDKKIFPREIDIKLHIAALTVTYELTQNPNIGQYVVSCKENLENFINEKIYQDSEVVKRCLNFTNPSMFFIP